MANVAREMAQLRQTSQDLCGRLHFLEAQKTESESKTIFLLYLLIHLYIFRNIDKSDMTKLISSYICLV